MLNFDWFKSCKHTEYTIGAYYISVMNLPRTLRFRQENFLLIGLTPGPKEPKIDINAFLGPLVQELQKYFVGVVILYLRVFLFVVLYFVLLVMYRHLGKCVGF